MPYLICDKCNIYYEIENGEDIAGFDTCSCGKPLKYYDTLEEYMNGEENKDYKAENHFKCREDDLLLIMNTLRDDHEREHKEHLQRELNYKIRHSRGLDNEKTEIHTDIYESIVAKELRDTDLTKKKEMLIREMELLKEEKNK